MSLQGSTAFILKNDWVKIAKKKYKKKRTKGNFPYEMLKCTIKKKHYNNESIVEKKWELASGLKKQACLNL